VGGTTRHRTLAIASDTALLTKVACDCDCTQSLQVTNSVANVRALKFPVLFQPLTQHFSDVVVYVKQSKERKLFPVSIAVSECTRTENVFRILELNPHV
jgi:hypothetical protein